MGGVIAIRRVVWCRHYLVSTRGRNRRTRGTTAYRSASRGHRPRRGYSHGRTPPWHLPVFLVCLAFPPAPRGIQERILSAAHKNFILTREDGQEVIVRVMLDVRNGGVRIFKVKKGGKRGRGRRRRRKGTTCWRHTTGNASAGRSSRPLVIQLPPNSGSRCGFHGRRSSRGKPRACTARQPAGKRFFTRP